MQENNFTMLMKHDLGEAEDVLDEIEIQKGYKGILDVFSARTRVCSTRLQHWEDQDGHLEAVLGENTSILVEIAVRLQGCFCKEYKYLT